MRYAEPMRSTAWAWSLLVALSACTDDTGSEGADTGIILDGGPGVTSQAETEDSADGTGGKLDVAGTASVGDGGDVG